jgi:hypothetical protein
MDGTGERFANKTRRCDGEGMRYMRVSGRRKQFTAMLYMQTFAHASMLEAKVKKGSDINSIALPLPRTPQAAGEGAG